MYNGMKRKHKVKYSCVVFADCMIPYWFAPATVHANDAAMHGDSYLHPRLECMREQLGQEICLYKDAAYPRNKVLLHALTANDASARDLRLVGKMSKCRESMEWIFRKLCVFWPSVTSEMRKTTCSRAKGKEDRDAMFPTYYHTCAYGGITNSYFGVRPPFMCR